MYIFLFCLVIMCNNGLNEIIVKYRSTKYFIGENIVHEAVALCAECTVCVVFYLENGVCGKKTEYEKRWVWTRVSPV